MNSERFPADDPREWLRRARSNLSQAKGGIQHYTNIRVKVVKKVGCLYAEKS